jgi:hypothetical protein
MKEITSETIQGTLIKALKLFLHPLIKLLIHHNVTFPQLRELLKDIYIEAAGEIIEDDGQEVNYSRIYMLTGVHRKDIKRLRETNADQSSATTNLSLGGALIARWTALPEYLTDDGSPRRLKKTGNKQEPGFDQLVTSVSKDIRPRAVLDEWIRQKIVTLEDDLVVLNQSAFVPAQNFEQLCYYLGHNLHDHIATATDNLLHHGEPMLERSVYYARLTQASVEKLHQAADAQAMKMLTDINKKAMALHNKDKFNQQATHRFRLGCYWHQQEVKS